MSAKKTTQGVAKRVSTKKQSTAQPKAGNEPKKLSAIDAATKVLAESKTAMTTREMIEAMSSQGLWTSPGGATPWATLYSAIEREISAKGKDARFTKTGRGKFSLKA